MVEGHVPISRIKMNQHFAENPHFTPGYDPYGSVCSVQPIQYSSGFPKKSGIP